MTTWHGGVSHSPGGTSRNLVTLPRIAHKVNLRIVCFWNFPCDIFLDHRRLGNRNHGKQNREKGIIVLTFATSRDSDYFKIKR